jgi:hypothetical protein
MTVVQSIFNDLEIESAGAVINRDVEPGDVAIVRAEMVVQVRPNAGSCKGLQLAAGFARCDDVDAHSRGAVIEHLREPVLACGTVAVMTSRQLAHVEVMQAQELGNVVGTCGVWERHGAPVDKSGASDVGR